MLLVGALLLYHQSELVYYSAWQYWELHSWLALGLQLVQNLLHWLPVQCDLL